MQVTLKFERTTFNSVKNKTQTKVDFFSVAVCGRSIAVDAAIVAIAVGGDDGDVDDDDSDLPFCFVTSCCMILKATSKALPRARTTSVESF